MKKSKYGKLVILIYTLSIIFLITSCKSKKALVVGGELENKTRTELIDDVLKNELDYSTISTKGSLELKVGSSGQKATTLYKIIKDSIIQASVRPILGMEAFRINIMPDKIVIIDRMKKQYISEDIASFKKVVDFDYYNLQALFTDKLFIPGSKSVGEDDYEKFTLSATDEIYLLKTKDGKNMTYNFAVDASNRIVSTLIHKESSNFTIQWSYTDFVIDNGYTYPTSMLAKIGIGDKRVDLGINYSSLEVNKEVKIDTSIPDSYQKVTLKELLAPYIK